MLRCREIAQICAAALALDGSVEAQEYSYVSQASHKGVQDILQEGVTQYLWNRVVLDDDHGIGVWEPKVLHVPILCQPLLVVPPHILARVSPVVEYRRAC